MPEPKPLYEGLPWRHVFQGLYVIELGPLVLSLHYLPRNAPEPFWLAKFGGDFGEHKHGSEDECQSWLRGKFSAHLEELARVSSANSVCWHCRVLLVHEQRPYCIHCPTFGDCDNPECGQPGCEEHREPEPWYKREGQPWRRVGDWDVWLSVDRGRLLMRQDGGSQRLTWCPERRSEEH